MFRFFIARFFGNFLPSNLLASASGLDDINYTDDTPPTFSITRGLLSVNITTPENGTLYSTGSWDFLNATVECEGVECGDINCYAESCSGYECLDFALISSSGSVSTADANPLYCGYLYGGDSCNVTWNLTYSQVGTYRLNVVADSSLSDIADSEEENPPNVEVS